MPIDHILQLARAPVKRHSAGFRVFTTRPTSVKRHPSTDFIVIMRRDDMRGIGASEDDYVLLKNVVIKDVLRWNCDAGDEHEKAEIRRFMKGLCGDGFEPGDVAVSGGEDEMTITCGTYPPVKIAFGRMDTKELMELIPELKFIMEHESGDATGTGSTLRKGIKFTGIAKCKAEGGKPVNYLCRDNAIGQRLVTELVDMKIDAHLISAKNHLSEIDEEDLKGGKVALDKTLRAALGLKTGEDVHIIKAHRSVNAMEAALMTLNYQKVVARVQQNAPFMESRTPVACVCDEIADSIGARYGDEIVVETEGKKIRVRCARLTPFMREYHDSVIGSSMSRAEMDEINKKYENTWVENPFNFLTRSGIVSRTYDELIHPIFMDQTSRKAIGVKPLEPVKVRRSFWWELRKKLNSFSSIGMLAVSILIPHFIVMHTQGDLPPWLAPATLAPLLAFIIWSMLTTSKYET